MTTSVRDMIARRSAILRCPSCKLGHLELESEACLSCLECRATFPLNESGVPSLLDEESYGDHQREMSQWWDDLYLQWYANLDKALSTERLYELFDELEQSYRDQNHLIFSMDLENLQGQEVLDIGCGGGIHDALFRKYGANVTAVDISGQRALSTSFKMSLVREGSGFAAQTNGENLPFQDDSFDMIYSNGVMHHSESTEAMVAEAFRVLKPGGRFVGMLYSRFSSHYAILLLYCGLLRGYYLKYGSKYWLGACTEGRPKYGSVRNPFTSLLSLKNIAKDSRQRYAP